MKRCAAMIFLLPAVTSCTDRVTITEIEVSDIVQKQPLESSYFDVQISLSAKDWKFIYQDKPSLYATRYPCGEFAKDRMANLEYPGEFEIDYNYSADANYTLRGRFYTVKNEVGGAQCLQVVGSASMFSRVRSNTVKIKPF